MQLAVTFAEALIGFLIASALAFAVAILFVRFHTLEEGLFPIAIAVKTTPIVAVAPLLVIWLGNGMVVQDRRRHPDLFLSRCW